MIGFDVTGDIDFGGTTIAFTGLSDFTIDASDAPGNGVQIVNGGIAFFNCCRFRVEYLRVRPVEADAAPTVQGITVGRGAHHFILKNCEVETQGDDGITVFLEAGYSDLHDFVIEDCLSAFGVNHDGGALGLSVDGATGAGVGNIQRFSVRNNLVANCIDRAPKIRGFADTVSNVTRDGEIINNLSYNVLGARPELLNVLVNIRHEGNIHIHGPSQSSTTTDFNQRCEAQAMVALSSPYQANNFGRNYDGAGSTRAAVIGGYDGVTKFAYTYLSSAPHHWTNAITDPDELYETLVTNRRCGAVLPAIDDLTAEVYRTIEEDDGYILDVAADTGINLGGTYPGIPDLTA